MSYATPADLRQWFEQNRLERYVSGELADMNDLLQAGLDVASAEMDGAFQMGGYSVPIDPEEAGAAEAVLTAQLRRHCMALALDHLRLGLDALPQNIVGQVADSRKWLRDIRGLQGIRRDGSSGRVASFVDLPGLSRAG